MKNSIYYYILLFGLLLGSVGSTQAQIGAESRMGATDGGYWTFGLNIGGAWQDSDINTNGGIGFGAYIGHSIFHKSTSPFSFDWRLRYMATWTYGQNSADNTLGKNSILGKAPYNYNPSTGFFAHNHMTNLHDFSAEFRLNFEELRRKHRVLLSVYAGVGLGFYSTRVDQLDLLDNPYNYDGIDQNQTEAAICDDINFMRDHEFETKLYNRLTITPTIGAEFGYWFTPHFALAIGHKTSFTLDDRFDGLQNNTAGDPPGAIHHYTALNLHWRLFGEAQGSVECPRVRFSLPTQNNGSYTTSQSNVYLEADVTNVKSGQITYTINGERSYEFMYSNSNWNSNVKLKRGRNVITLKAKNSCGVQIQQVTVMYQPEDQAPVGNVPVVSISQPNNNSTTNISSTTVSASILHIFDANNVTFTVNGVPSRGFTLSGTRFVANNVNLQQGSNTISITVTNQSGSDTKTVIVNYIQNQSVPSNEVAPIVTITSPQPSPFTTRNSRVSINATIKHVTTRSNVIFKVNGQVSNNFSFSGTQFLANSMALQQGNNTFTITGINNVGQDTETVIVIYAQENTNLPIVTITNPTRNPATMNVPSVNCMATINYVPNRSGVSCTINGQSFTGFSFNNTRFVANNIPLREGSNTITIMGTNTAGQDVATTQVIYQVPVVLPAPIVRITYPTANPYNTQQNATSISATIQHVTTRSEVTFKVNGQVSNNFNFSGGVLSASNINLRQGANTFTVIGTNSVGQDSKSTIVIYEIPQELPVVAFTNPAQSPYNTTSNTIELQANVLNVTGKNNIRFTINGQATNSFSFFGTNFVASNIPLRQGNNTFTITGTNTAGQDMASTVIIYNMPTPAPVVTITTPRQNPYVTTTNVTNINATILNVGSSRDVRFSINGRNVTNFNFSGTQFSAPNVVLAQGSNSFTITGTNSAGQDTKSTVVIYNKEEEPAPIVTITSPNANPFNTQAATTNIRASILNVTNKNDVQFVINGQATNNFSFSGTSFVANNITLRQGSNTFTITGTNETGRDSKTTVVIYSEPTPAPIVMIQSPDRNPTTVSNPAIVIRANVQHVPNASGITFTVNGQTSTAFNYNNGIFTSSTVSLNSGNNTFTITGTNSTGRDTKSTVVIYQAPAAPAPIVNITNPRQNPLNTQTNSIKIEATIQHVTSRNDVTFVVNGQAITSFNFSGTSFSADNITLRQGNNTFVITGTNETGRDSKSTVVVYTIPTPPPVVTIQSPDRNPTTVSNSTIVIRASIQNVANSSGVTFTVNGQSSSAFTYNNGVFVSSGVALNAGANTIAITGTNSTGRDNKSTVVIYQAPVIPAPIVRITSPSDNPHSVEAATANIRATIQNVTGSNNVTFAVNGQNVRNFNFSGTSFSASNVALNPGNNTFTITGTNASGQDSKSTVILRVVKEVVLPPAVTITVPNRNPTATTSSNTNIQATIRNVDTKAGVTFAVNGQNVTNFNYSRGSFSATGIKLVPGNNTFTITGRNESGQDSKSTVVTYNAPVLEQLPTVKITSPNTNPHTSSTSVVNITATINHVSSRSGVTFTVNGRNETGFSFRGTAFGMNNIALNTGNNTFVITGKNSAGQDSKSTIVVYNPVPAPTVLIQAPDRNPTTVRTNNNIAIRAKITNVTNVNDVTVTINGVNQAIESYSNGTLRTGALNLAQGNNTVIVMARNAGGQDSKSTVIIYDPVLPTPVVTFTTPAQNPLTTADSRLNLRATVLNVVNKSDMTFTVNGRVYTNYTLSNNTFAADGIRLGTGNNTFSINARNRDGQVTVTTVVIYNAATAPTNNSRTNQPNNTNTVNPDAVPEKTKSSKMKSGTTTPTTEPEPKKSKKGKMGGS